MQFLWTRRFFLSLVGGFLVAVLPAHAGPANPEPVAITQPDGTVFQAITRGDEFQGWMETADGYTVLRNPATGFFDYAVRSAVGPELVPSGMAVAQAMGVQQRAQALLPPKGLRPPRNAEREQYQEQFLNNVRASRMASGAQRASAVTGIWAPTPVSGAKKILLLLVSFQDTPLSANAATYWYNAVHNTGAPSVAKYYQDNSFGAVSIAPVPSTQPGSPSGVVTVALAQNHPNCLDGDCSYAVEAAFVKAALAAAASYVNFAALDTNGNGTISVDEALVYLVIAGYETSAGSGLTPSYWAHAMGGSGVTVGGKTIDHWALNGERYSTANLMQMGVIAHEMGHAMGGLPDLYDTSGTNEGLGFFSLMAGGSWGAQAGEIGGATPTAMDAWSRYYLGWSTPRTLANGTVASFANALSGATAPVLLLNAASSTSEYWLVENRPPMSWDAGLYRRLGSWSGGLLVQHIDSNIGSKSGNTFNTYVAGRHQGNMVEEPATALCSLSSTTNASSGCKTLLYYAGNSTTFNGASAPSSNYYSGAASSLGLSGISAPGSVMTATIQAPVVAAPVTPAPGAYNTDVRAYVPNANAPSGYTSFLRTINTSTSATPVYVTVIDGTTGALSAYGTLTTSLPAGAAVTFAASQIETALGFTLPANDRPRMRVTTAVPIEVQSFMSNPTGAITQLADALTGATSQLVRFYVPAAQAASGYTSFIRVINAGSVATPVQVTLINPDTGAATHSGQLTASLAPKAAVTFTAQQVEAAMGNPLTINSKAPRILVAGNVALEVQSFMSNPGGIVSQNSGAQAGAAVPVRFYMPAANEATGYYSVLRVINTGSGATAVNVSLLDEYSGQATATGQLTASLAANGALALRASAVEAALGVTLAAPERPRLLVSSPTSSPLQVQSLLVNPSGVYTQLVEAQSGTTIDIRAHVPAALASSYNSFLRVINTSSVATPVNVSLINGTTGAVGWTGRLITSLPAGRVLTFSAQEVEAALGLTIPATDRPRIRITTSAPIEVQSFMSNPGGVLTETGNFQ